MSSNPVSVDIDRLKKALARLKEHEAYAAKQIERCELTGHGESVVTYWIGELHIAQIAQAYLAGVILED